jgi:uncharacterized protein (TIGR02271 family)
MEQEDQERVVPVLEEELVAGARRVKTGSVRVEKHVERRIRRVDLPLLKEDVEIRRVPVNRVVNAPPVIRRSGDVIVVPVVEEQITITRRLVLKEEVHVLRRRTRERITKEIPVERERAVIQKLDSRGRVVDSTRPRRGVTG